MSKNFRVLYLKLLNPPKWTKILNLIITLLSTIASLCLVFIDSQKVALQILAYVVYGIAGLSLTYTVFLFIKVLPNIKKKTLDFIKRYDFTYLLVKNFGFRTVIFAIGSFVFSLIFSAFNVYMCVVNRSVWYGALAGYYIAIAFVRGGVLFYHKNKLGKKEELWQDGLTRAKIYRNSGIVMLILNVALSVAIAQVIFEDAHFYYVGWTIFGYAAYTFYKITTSIISFIRAQKHSDLTVRVIRDINLTDALVSILALQTALLSMFADQSIDTSLMNTLTGSVVSLGTIALSIYIITASTKIIKKLQKGNDKNGKQSI